MAVTFCTSGTVKLKAGVNRPADDTVLTATQYETLINQAESFINCAIGLEGVDWVSLFSGLNTDVKKIFEDAASAKAANEVIKYDASGYTSRAEAQTMLDVNYSTYKDCIEILKNKIGTNYIRSV